MLKLVMIIVWLFCLSLANSSDCDYELHGQWRIHYLVCFEDVEFLLGFCCRDLGIQTVQWLHLSCTVHIDNASNRVIFLEDYVCTC